MSQLAYKVCPWELQGPLDNKSADVQSSGDYLNPWLLDDGTLIALRNHFYRNDPDGRIAIVETVVFCRVPMLSVFPMMPVGLGLS